MLEKDQVSKAVEGLKVLVEKTKKPLKKQLNESEDPIQLIIGYKSLNLEKRNTPVEIRLPHSVFDPLSGDNAFLIVKEPASTVKLILEKYPVKGIEKVVSLEKMRTNFSSYKQRRELVHAYSCFLCDQRILPMMPSVLGKAFYIRKRHPVSVKVSSNDAQVVSRSIQDALCTVQYFVGWGPCSNLHIGKMSMEPSDVADNILCVMQKIVDIVGEETIQSISIKTADSMSIPLFGSLRDIPEEEDVPTEETAPDSEKSKEKPSVTETTTTTKSSPKKDIPSKKGKEVVEKQKKPKQTKEKVVSKKNEQEKGESKPTKSVKEAVKVTEPVKKTKEKAPKKSNRKSKA